MNESVFLELLEDCVNKDDVNGTLELIKTKPHYTWSNDLNSLAINNCIKRNEILYWYKLLYWIVDYNSINVCDAIEKLEIYTPGHIYLKMFKKAVLSPIPILNLIDRLLLKVDPGHLLFGGNILADLFSSNITLTTEHWVIIEKLIIDSRSISQGTLLYLLKYKDFIYILNLFKNSNLSLTNPSIIPDILITIELCNPVLVEKFSKFLYFILQMPSNCISNNIIESLYTSPLPDFESFFENLFINCELEFIKQLDLNEYDGVIIDIFEYYIENPSRLTQNIIDIINYIINETDWVRNVDYIFISQLIDNVHLMIENYAALIIQRGCHNWLWKPICKDGSLGINCRLSIRQLNLKN